VNSPQPAAVGVGPQEQLAQFGIPVVHNLPGVGQACRTTTGTDQTEVPQPITVMT
jgi:hypothetical protein